MAVDKRVRESVIEAVQNYHQADKVTQKIINLLEELSNGTVNLNNKEDIQTYLDIILEAIES
jgi:hypothetical protein